jgi:hypothetical protein
MRVMIEIDLPDGQKIPTAEQIKQLTDPNWLAEWWHIDDVKGVDGADDLSEDECREVLRLVGKEHKADIGINWEEIEYWVNYIIEEREYEAN